MSTATTKSKPAKSTSVKETAMSETALSNGLDTVTHDIAGVSVVLPNRFAAMVGQPLTPDFAKIIFVHVSGQFRNNQVANAKNRADRYAKATDDATRADNTPLTEADYLKIWADYMPQVGGGPRQSGMEKTRYDAAKAAWVEIISDHNEAIANGQPGILKSNKAERVAPRPIKTKAVSTEAHDAAVADWQDKQDAIYKFLLSSPAHADRIQRHMDRILAEQGKAKGETDAPAAGLDLLAG